MAEPPFVPAYSKPDAPGVWMNFDNTVSIYHIVGTEDSFEQAALDVFDLLRKAQEQFPDWPRVFFLDIAGHEGEHLGFDRDFFEFQQEFLFSVLAPFVTGLETPATGALLNPDPQRNDVPDRLRVASG